MEISQPSVAWLAALASIALILAGLVVLRLRWLRWRNVGRIATLAGWLLITAGFTVFGLIWGAEVGIFFGLLGLSAAAYFVIALGVELRKPKARAARSLAEEPEERPTNWTRAIAKSFLAVVLAGVAAIGIGVAFAVAMPIGVQDRIMIGGILVPVLWGAGMAWTLSDAKVLRATLLLSLISVVAYSIAFLPKVLPSG